VIPFNGCPHCRSMRFLAGPCGGSAQNVTCLGCSARFNLLIPPLLGLFLLIDELSGPTGEAADTRGAAYIIELVR
jgi:hypothetical protein